jgi:signal transduction histidine kinase
VEVETFQIAKISLIEDSNGNNDDKLMFFFSDVSAEKRLTRELCMKNDIKTMFSVISHEFRGPIASI